MGGFLLSVEGPQPYSIRQYYCTTHGSKFSMFSGKFAPWLYSEESGYGWDDIRPAPVIVRHGDTCMTAEFLAWVKNMFESNTTVMQIVTIVQKQWRDVYWQRVDEYVGLGMGTASERDSLVKGTQPWWVQAAKHQVFTDRRKVREIIAAYFATFHKEGFNRDMQIAKEQFCHGLSIDETFRVALKCSLAVRKEDGSVGGYRAAPYALQTVHSCVTQMAVHYELMPGKASGDKARGVRSVFEVQAAAGAKAVMTRFVATDSPPADERMLKEVHADVFQGRAGAGSVDVGDDQWHVYHRIEKHLPGRSVFDKQAKAALKKCLSDVVQGCKKQWQYAMADPRMEGVELWAWQAVCVCWLGDALDEWEAAWAHGPDGPNGPNRRNERACAAVAACKENGAYLFKSLAHLGSLGVSGTTANENCHFMLNRRTKFCTHMRPDHCLQLIEYCIWLQNGTCARRCEELGEVLSKEQCTVVSTMFVNPPGIPFREVAGRHKCPYVMEVLPDPRVYDLPEYNAQFGATRDQQAIEAGLA
jgi:hypothetical protein